MQTGIIDSSTEEAIHNRNIYNINNTPSKILQQATDEFRNSFNDDIESIIEKTKEAISKEANKISINQLQAINEILRFTSENNLADKLITAYWENRDTKTKEYEIQNAIDFDVKLDSFLIDKIKDPKNKTTQSTNEILNKDKNFTDEAIFTLNKSNPDDFYQAFKAIKGETLISNIRRCLESATLTRDGQTKLNTQQKTAEALRRIASESKLNEYRVRRIFNRYESIIFPEKPQ